MIWQAAKERDGMQVVYAIGTGEINAGGGGGGVWSDGLACVGVFTRVFGCRIGNYFRFRFRAYLTMKQGSPDTGDILKAGL